jgi:hypothetical protein
LDETREARCKDCKNRKSDRFCAWLGAFLQPGLIDDPDCEGYVSKDSHAQPKRGKGSTCPKTPTSDKSMILAALELKKLKGSIVREGIDCGKSSCHCQHGSLHPASYLHYYSNGKVRRRYLSRAMVELLRFSETELEERLRESEEVLGQGSRSSETSGVVTG